MPDKKYFVRVIYLGRSDMAWYGESHTDDLAYAKRATKRWCNDVAEIAGIEGKQMLPAIVQLMEMHVKPIQSWLITVDGKIEAIETEAMNVAL